MQHTNISGINIMAKLFANICFWDVFVICDVIVCVCDSWICVKFKKKEAKVLKMCESADFFFFTKKILLVQQQDMFYPYSFFLTQTSIFPTNKRFKMTKWGGGCILIKICIIFSLLVSYTKTL